MFSFSCCPCLRGWHCQVSEAGYELRASWAAVAGTPHSETELVVTPKWGDLDGSAGWRSQVLQTLHNPSADLFGGGSKEPRAMQARFLPLPATTLSLHVAARRGHESLKYFDVLGIGALVSGFSYACRCPSIVSLKRAWSVSWPPLTVLGSSGDGACLHQGGAFA